MLIWVLSKLFMTIRLTLIGIGMLSGRVALPRPVSNHQGDVQEPCPVDVQLVGTLANRLFEHRLWRCSWHHHNYRFLGHTSPLQFCTGQIAGMPARDRFSVASALK
jgi:hypothetical protein